MHNRPRTVVDSNNQNPPDSLKSLTFAGSVALVWLLVSHSSAVQADAIYQTLDNDGKAVFTDQRSAQAQVVKTRTINVSTSEIGTTQAQREAALNAPPVIAPGTQVQSPDDARPRNIPQVQGSLATALGNAISANAAGNTNQTPVKASPATLARVAAAPEPVATPDAANAGKTEAADPPEPTEITRLSIIEPDHDNALIDPKKPFWVELGTEPASIEQSALTAQLWLDDTLVSQGKRDRIQLPIPYHGSHKLIARLVDNDGEPVVESAPVTIHIREHIVSSN
jgi:hypothetical protein